MYMHACRSIIHNSQTLKTIQIDWKQSNNWQIMHKMRYVHIMKFYSAIKKNEELTRVTTQMNLKNMLNERTQMQMMTYCMTAFI